jgi:hypothetical protein
MKSKWFIQFAFASLVVLTLASRTSAGTAVNAQATMAATTSAISVSITLPKDMEVALVPCGAGVTGPCDLIATKVEDVVGVWKQYLGGPPANAPGGMTYIRFNADGTFNLADTVEHSAKPMDLYPSGTYKFEGGLLVFDAITTAPPPCNGPGVFQARVLKYGDKPVALRYVAISDTCGPRLQDLSQAAVWVAPNTR